MARRHTEKARRTAAPAREDARGKGKPPVAKPAAGETGEARIAALERERDQLRAELEQAEARCRTLEDNHTAVRDRIAWALDSLENILNGRG